MVTSSCDYDYLNIFLTPMYSYPNELVAVIKKLWNASVQHKKEQVPELPTDDTLKNLIDVAYHASFLTEEQRRIGFKLIFCSKENLSKNPKFFKRDYENSYVVSFSKPREFSVSELLRIAPATDFTRILICVDEYKTSRSKKSSLKIWGLLDTGSSWWDFIHGESSKGIPPPNALTISSNHPGQLSISRQGFNIINLRQGNIFTPPRGALYLGQLNNFFLKAQEDLYSETCKKIGTDCYDPDGHDDEYPKRLYISYLERILFQIREKNHGGTLIIVPDHFEVTDKRLTDRILIKYTCKYDRAWQLLSTQLAKHRKYYDLYFSLWDGEKEINNSHFREITILDGEREELEEIMSDSVKFIASISGVDGAVVMTDKFRLLGFGGEVIAPSFSLSKIKIAGETKRHLPIEMYGTRHRSAFRFCFSYEDSVAFIVSQDGGIKAVKQVGSELLLWTDISIGSWGL